MALGTEPFESVDRATWPGVLDHEADAVRIGPLRRVSNVRRKEVDVTLGDGHVARRLTGVVGDAQVHRALQLVEELGPRIVVEVGPHVAPTNDRDDHVGVLPDLAVGHRWLQRLGVLVDPTREIERDCRVTHRRTSAPLTMAVAFISINRWG